MSRGGFYSSGKRQRDADKARKKQEKAQRRAERREHGPGEVPIVSAAEVTGDLPSISEAMQAIESGGSAGRSSAPIPTRLFVGGLSYDTTESDLRAAFGEYGPVADAFVVKDRDTGNSRGFGFVTMENRKDASKAIEALHDSDLGGRTIVVNIATDRAR